MRGVAGLFFVALLVVPQLAGATTGPARTPALTVVDRAPLTIAGRGFVANRDVTIVVQTPGGIERRTLRAGDLGRFRLELPAVSLTGRLRCGAGVVIAARTKGDDLVLWHQVLPNCPMPLRPPST